MFEPDLLKRLLVMPEDSQPVAILCWGHVEKFFDKPVLKQEHWADRKDLKNLLF